MSWREATSFIDPTYGQRSVFGVGHATIEEDEELDVQDEEEALEYLRLVREEASKIPTVMIARQHGPQLFPPHMMRAAAEGLQKKQKKQKQKQRRKQRRHWDDLDDGPSTKKRRVAGQAPVELSYDDDAEQEEKDTEVKEEEEEEEGEVKGEDEEVEVEEDEDEEAKAAQAFYDRALYQNARDDALGFYADGAYTAAPDVPDVPDTPNSVKSTDLTALFRAHLLARFATLRAQLQQDPPAAAVAALPANKHPTSVGSLHNKSGAFARWLLLLQTTDPQPAQVAAMDRVSAFRLVRVLLQGLQVGASQSSRSSRTGKYVRWLSGGGRLSRGLQVDRRTSRWLWAVLARLPASGELGYVEMGDIRELAKEAVLRLAHLSYAMEEGEVEAEAEDEEEGEEKEEGEGEAEDDVQEGEIQEEEGEVQEELENGEAQAQVATGDYNMEDMAIDAESEPEETETTETAEAKTDLQDAGDDMHQRATLEMVLAVAGEFYGQRDLLAFRSPWPTA